MLVNTLFERKVDRLRDIAKRLAIGLDAAGIPYEVVGGFAVFCHVDRIDPLRARLTRDVDVAVDRRHLGRIAQAMAAHGFAYRGAAGIDMLVDAAAPGAGGAIRLIFVGEKVRQDMDSVGLITAKIEADLSEPLRVRLAEVRATE
jgi:hypothetical protein